MSRLVNDAGNEYYASDQSTLAVKWTAPEGIEYKKFSHKADVWSFGVALWELYSDGKVPYSNLSNKETVDYVLSGYRLPQPEKCPDDIWKLMCKCWLKSATDRPSFLVQFS